ncbi:MAG: hypothetical protein DRI54_06890, partial [Bacteroidetes bacterium]
YTWVDSSIYYNTWKTKAEWETGNTLFSIAKIKYTQKDFIEYLKMGMAKSKLKKPTNPSLRSYVDQKYKLFVDRSVMNYEKAHLEEKYPEFRALMNEYHDGILLFELSDNKVWSRATTDTTGLKEFYESHKNEHMWPERAEASIYKSIDKATADKVLAWVNSGLDNDSIRANVNRDSQLNLVLESGIFTAEDDPVLSEISWSSGISEIKELNGQFVFVNISEIRKPEPKSLDETKGIVISEYQKYLENEWISELRAKYPYEVNKDVLYSIADED